MAPTAASARPLTNHIDIRRWAEERNATPSCVKRTGGGDDVGMIRLDFPGYSGGESLQEISWDDWFDKFDERNLALVVQDTTARGQTSNFNKLVSRDTVGERATGKGRNRSGRSSRRGGSRTRATRGRASSRRTRAAISGRAGRAKAGKSSSRRTRSTGRISAKRQVTRSRSERTAATGKKSPVSARGRQPSRSASRSSRRRAA